MDLKSKDLEVSNKQRIINKLLKQVEVQAERAEVLINNKSEKRLIVAQCEKLRITIQEGFKLEESLTTASETLHSAVEVAVVEVSAGENTNKKYEAISAHMIGLVEEYKFMFVNLSWKYQKFLREIPDPEQNSGQSSNSSLDRSSWCNYDHIRPTTLNIDSSVSKVEIWQGRFQIWITELVKPGKPDDDCKYVFESLLSSWTTDGPASSEKSRNAKTEILKQSLKQ